MNQTNLAQLLTSSKIIAVVGASPNPARPSHWISKYLMNQGYQIIPVNPGHSKLFGVKCFPDLESITTDIDIINIFRRSDQVLPIVISALKRAKLRLIWMQDNVYDEAAADAAQIAGIPLVMNDCIYRFHRRLA